MIHTITRGRVWGLLDARLSISPRCVHLSTNRTPVLGTNKVPFTSSLVSFDGRPGGRGRDGVRRTSTGTTERGSIRPPQTHSETGPTTRLNTLETHDKGNLGVPFR